jgi:hypothetical protein
VSYFKVHDAVLFPMHTVFRKHGIELLAKNHHLFYVDLILISRKDKNLCVLTDRIREEISPDEGWYSLS